MELSTFSENIVKEVFERSGELVELRINLDALVPDYSDVVTERLEPATKRLNDLMEQHSQLQSELEALEKKQKGKKSKQPIDFAVYAKRLKEIQKGMAEVKSEIFAEQLTCPVSLPDGSTTCILKGWDITENGMAIDASKENLLRMPAPAVEALFDFIMSKMSRVKKRVDEEEEETSEVTHTGSMALRAVGQNG